MTSNNGTGYAFTVAATNLTNGTGNTITATARRLLASATCDTVTCTVVAVSRTWGSLPIERPRALVFQGLASQRK